LLQKVDKWRAQGLVEKSPTQDPTSASGGLKLLFTRPSFVPGADRYRARWRCLYITKMPNLNCVVAPFLFASPSLKSTINKVSIPIRLLKRMIMVFQIIAEEELLNPRSMKQCQ
jgi:hypothetical protein